jgi:outer membrane protein OmpU
MRISAIPVVLAFCASTVALAQSSVTLYGSVDNGVTYVNNAGGKATVLAMDGVNKANSLGFLGSENLGGGLKAIFALDSAYSINSGKTLESGVLFGNQAYLGLENSSIGQLTAGRQFDYTVYLEKYLPCLQCGIYVVTAPDVDRVGGERLNNAIQLTTRDLAGLSLGAMYSFAGSGGGATNTGRAYSIKAEYSRGPFGAIGVVTDINGATLASSVLGTATIFGQPNTTPVLAIDKQRIIGLGASFAISKLTLLALYTNTRLTLNTSSSTYQVLHAGGQYRVTPALLLSAAAVASKFEQSRWYTLDTGVDYNLSKRTDVYVDGLFQRATGPGTVAAIALIPLSSTRSQIVARIGVRHFF